ncbi:hypothetical protein CEXT_304541 [Caerostris extrusa]|uniref:Uncharacterized protein n=1 Tax=Caerostris extrusa TaxID=172846 RepID=A0AAV4ND27_CAEEX|nr:hypothetical protein CEXT_304541 [Caerostris extrusa]
MLVNPDKIVPKYVLLRISNAWKEMGPRVLEFKITELNFKANSYLNLTSQHCQLITKGTSYYHSLIEQTQSTTDKVCSVECPVSPMWDKLLSSHSVGSGLKLTQKSFRCSHCRD